MGQAVVGLVLTGGTAGITIMSGKKLCKQSYLIKMHYQIRNFMENQNLSQV